MKILVPYSFSVNDHDVVELGLSVDTRKPPTKWLPALRDTVRGARVVWARFEDSTDNWSFIWIKDKDGSRPVKRFRGDESW